MILISSKLQMVIDSISSIALSIPHAFQYVKLMVKVLCIIIITQFVCDICRDNGENAIASFTEIGAKIVVISMIMPLFESIISIVSGLVK